MSTLLHRALAALLHFARSEPAVILGTLGSVALVAADVVLDVGATDWDTAAPALIGFVIRQLVTPTPTAAPKLPADG